MSDLAGYRRPSASGSTDGILQCWHRPHVQNQLNALRVMMGIR
jgi:hypothetical protein